MNNSAAILNKSVLYFKPFTSNVFLRNNEAYKLYYTLKERYLSVYNIRKVYFASLLSFLKK